jgi:DNA-binding NarL/FixJ family response regulator
MPERDLTLAVDDDGPSLPGLVTGFRVSRALHRQPAWPSFLTGQAEKPVRVLVICDAAYTRTVISPELMSDNRTLLTGQADTVRDGRRLILTHDFDVLLVNLYLPDGCALELIPYARKLRPGIEAIVVSPAEESEEALRAFEVGASGYLVRNSWFDSVVQAVLQVANGGACITPTVARRLLLTREPDRTLPAAHAPNGPLSKLSDRECEILRMVANGMTSGEIARRLVISPMTVNTHMKHVYHKLQARTRAQAVRRASDWGVL